MLNKKYDCTLWAVLLIGLGTSGMCRAQEKPKEQSKQSIAAEASGHTTVLPAGEEKTFFFPKGTQYWTPAASDIARLEEDLPGLAKTLPAPPIRPYGSASPRSILVYYRQYIGVIQNGKRCIYINAFRGTVGTEFANWKNHAVEVYDGGDAFYHVTYDMKSHKFVKFAYNGYA